MRKKSLIALGLLGVLGAAIGLAGDSPADVTPQVVVVKFHSATAAASREVDAKFLTKARAAYEERNVLFLTADVGTRGGQHQAKMLLNALDLGAVYRAHANTPGAVVVVDALSGRPVKVLGAKDSEATFRAAVDPLLETDDMEGMEEEPEEPMDEGCGEDMGEDER